MSIGKLVGFAVLALCVSGAKLHAQSSCFTVRVRLNGQPIPGPQTLTLKTKEWEKTASAEDGCIKVPVGVLETKSVDVLFTVPKNRVYLSAIPTGFLTGPWDVDLADKHFGGDGVLPKHARPKDVCVVVFHVGEPEATRTLTRCRTAF